MNFSDDYKRMDFYERHAKGVRDGFNSFSVKEEHFFTLHMNGRICLVSEAYASKKGRDNGIASVKKNIKKKERYKFSVPRGGKFSFLLVAGNNQSIGKSSSFGTEIAMHKAAQNLREKSAGLIKSSGKASTKSKASSVVKKTPKKSTTSSKAASSSSSSVKKVAMKGAYHDSKLTYKIFKSSNDRYYFTFRDDDDAAVVMNNNVRGYATLDKAKDGLSKVLEFGPSKSNYEIKETKNGKYYFFIKDAKGKNVGKSFFYGTKKECNAAISLLLKGKSAGGRSTSGKSASASKSTGSKKSTSKTTVKKAGTNDYLPINRYTGKSGFHTFETKAGVPYFAYNSRSGTYLRSEGYSSDSARQNGIRSVLKNSKDSARWGTEKVGSRWFYYLKAGNGQEIGRSGGYDSEAAMKADYQSAKRNLSNLEESSVGALNKSNNAAAGTAKKAISPAKAKSSEKKTDSSSKDKKSLLSDKTSTSLGASDTKKSDTTFSGDKDSIAKEPNKSDNLKVVPKSDKIYESKSSDSSTPIKPIEPKSSTEKNESFTDDKRASSSESSKVESNFKEEKRIIESEKSGCSPWWLLLLLIPLIFLALWKGCAGDDTSSKAVKEAPKVVKQATENVTKKATETVTGIQNKTEKLKNDAVAKAEEARRVAAEKVRLAKAEAARKAAAAKKPIPAVKNQPAKATETAEAPSAPVAGQTRSSIASVLETCLKDAGCYAPKYYKWGGTRFSRNSSSINGSAFLSLGSVAGVLKRYPNARIEIYGHLANDESDFNISQARAKSVYDYLIQRGVSSSQLNYSGQGNNSPLKTGTDSQANYQNRRVEFVLTSK